MTDDYKDTLLKYFSGNLTKDDITPIYYNFPQFQETTSSESNIYTYIYTNVGSGFNILGTLQGYNSTYSVIYGNDSTNKGFMVILDETNTPIQFINTYSSGTAFGKFQILNVAEDGNFYGIDINNGTPRFIMLNNIVLVLPNQESFSVKLRQSYNLPSPLSTATSYFAITKAVGQGKYLIGATYLSQLLNKESPLVTELTINVGATNDWVNYNMDLTQWDFNGCSMWASWDNDELDFSISGYIDIVSESSINYIQFIKDNESQTNFNIRALENLNINGYSDGYYSVNTLLTSKDDGYIGVYDGGEYGTDELNWIYYCKGGSSQFEVIENFQKGTMLPFIDIDRKVQLKNINGNVFYMCKCYEKYTGVNDLYIYYGIVITDSDGDKRGISTNVVADGTTWRYDFLVSNIYNLYTYNILSLDFDNNTSVGSNYSTKQIYNPTNYNGEPYENVNSLVASTGEVYDSNNRLIFARNLYNNVVTNNTTMSVLQIPNTLLNDITLSSQSLLSQTNKILTTNQEDLVKNIYETVYYNFYNTLMIEDRNTPIFKPNMTGAVRINNSTSITTDYDNAKATKYRLNYSDDTNLVLPIQPTIQEEDSISGNNSLYITNAKEQENIISYSVDGATEQDGTPTPDNPVEVKTIPSIINLFDKENTSWYRNGNSAFSNTTNTSTSRIRTNSFLIKGGKSYTISGMPNGISLVAVRTYETNGGENLGNATLSGNTITLNSNVNYINIVFSGSNFTDSTNELMKNANIMLEEGSIPHEYVPYGYWSKVKVTGKNLFDKENTNWYRNNGTGFVNTNNTSTTQIRTNSFAIESGKTYVVSGIPDGITLYRVRTFSEYGGTYVRTFEPTNNSFTLNDNEIYVHLYFSGTNFTDETNELMKNANIQLEEGSTPTTTYEPYKENQVLIDMSKENLFDINSTNTTSNCNVSITDNIMTITQSGSYPYVEYSMPNLANGETYTISFNYTKPEDGQISVRIYDNTTLTYNVPNFATPTSGNKFLTFTANENTKIRFYGRATSGTNTSNVTYSNINIFKGNNPTPYHELSKIGNYKDTLSIDSSGNCVISKNVGKRVLNGSENWQINQEKTYVYQFLFNHFASDLNLDDCEIKSNYFKYQSGNPTDTTNEDYTWVYKKAVVIDIRKSITSTLANFKTWLGTHNTDVYYPLATPETINLPNTQIPLFEGINHVTFVDDLETDTSLEYDIPNVSTYTFSVLVPSDKTIDSLDILSNDELTLYHKIDTSSLENNKYYKITQNCHVEEG